MLGPKVAGAIRQVQNLGSEVAKPHKLNVDASGAKGALSGVMGMLGGLGIAAGIAAGAKAIVGMGVGLEQTRVQFETFTGSAEKGNAVIADLQKFANLTPFEDDQVISAGRQLLAFGEDAKNLNPILTKLGNISSATGKDFNELVSIYGKNKLSGVIQGEDLNQLTESGIPVMDSLARQLGVTTDQVKKMGADGKISFKMLEKSFDELGGAGGKWGDLMDKQSKTVAGRWSSLVGFAQNLGGKAGEALLPIMGGIVDGGNELLAFIQTNTAKLKQMFDPVVKAVQPLVDEFRNIKNEIFGTSEAGDILNTVFNVIATVIKYISPVIKVVATLLAEVYKQIFRVVQVIGHWLATSPRVQKFLSGLWEGAVATFKGIAEAAGKFLGGVGGIIEGVFTGDFGKIKEGLLQTMNAVGDTQFDKLGKKAADGFNQGYRDGFQPMKLFGADKVAGTDAASTFMGGGGKPGGAKAPAMTAAASKGESVSGVGGKGITNIHLTTGNIFPNATITAGTTQEAARDVSGQFGDWIRAALNDVNTLAST